MKILMIFAAVLLVTEAAEVPQLSPSTVLHQVTVPVPVNILATSPTTESVVEPAAVVEVSKDHVQKPDMALPVIEEEMVTVKPVTITDSAVDDEKLTTMSVDTHKVDVRNTRAVPFAENVDKPVKGQPKETPTTKNMLNNPHRSMRSVAEEMVSEQPLSVTDMPVNQIMEMSTINPCDLLCTKFEFDPVCATNGLCQHEFPNQCILETYNCKNPERKFSATKDNNCQLHWLTKCEATDLF